MAFPFICLDAEDYLNEKNELGIFIFDEHKEINDIEKSIRTLRQSAESDLKTPHIIEKGFFIKSEKSVVIQLVDLVIYYLRKWEEFKIGKKVSLIHQETFVKLEKISTSLDDYQKGFRILDWMDKRLEK